jgi:uncharacterized protein
MIIQISKISKDGSTFQGALSPHEVGFEGYEMVHPAGDLAYHLKVELIGTEILLRGSTRLPVECTCVRCGEMFSTMLEDSSFLRAYECKPEMFELDLSEDLRESIILVLPPHPVCREDCRGLCSGCGINLNRDNCTCKQETGGLSWSELDNLKLS